MPIQWGQSCLGVCIVTPFILLIISILYVILRKLDINLFPLIYCAKCVVEIS